MTVWRYTKLEESKVWKAERKDAEDITAQIEHKQVGRPRCHAPARHRHQLQNTLLTRGLTCPPR
jgi:hypothetical protein